MKILILGGCGFIGSHLAVTFLEDEHDVTIFDHVSAHISNIESIKNKIQLILGDFNDEKDLQKAVHGNEIVVHLISSVIASNALNQIVCDVKFNVIGSIKLFDICVKENVKKIIYLSSGGTVYGATPDIPIKENRLLNPINSYGVTKVAVEKYLVMYGYQYNLDYSIIRLSNPYGERQKPNTGQGVVATWLHKVKEKKPIEIWGDGSVIRDFIYIKDAVLGIKKAALTSDPVNVVNIGSGEGCSLNHLHSEIEKCVGKKIDITYHAMRNIDVKENVLDVSLAKKSLNWSANISLQEGLSYTWASIFGE